MNNFLCESLFKEYNKWNKKLEYVDEKFEGVIELEHILTNTKYEYALCFDAVHYEQCDLYGIYLLDLNTNIIVHEFYSCTDLNEIKRKLIIWVEEIQQINSEC